MDTKKERHFVNVPLDRSARISVETLFHSSIVGLYAECTASSNVLVCLGNQKISLLHIDQQTDKEQISQTLDWHLTDLKKVIIFHRLGAPIFFESFIATLKVVENKIATLKLDAQQQSVVALLHVKDDQILPRIELLPQQQRPKHLLHHPREVEMIAVSKIEQVVGLKEKLKTGIKRPKQHLLFDCIGWEPLLDSDMNLSSSETTQQEINFFNTTDPAGIVAAKIIKIIKALQKIDIQIPGVENEVVYVVSFYLEGYLNNFNAEFLFKQNMTYAFKLFSPETDADKQLAKALMPLSKKSAKTIQDKLEAYIEQAPESEYKQNITLEYKTFLSRHKQRLYDQEHSLQRQQDMEKMKALSHQGTQHYLAQKLDQATIAFSESLDLAIRRCVKIDVCLATAFYNKGRVLQQQDRAVSAQQCLQQALSIRKNYLLLKETDGDVLKTDRAIVECAQKIAFNHLFFSPTPNAIESRTYLLSFFNDSERKSMGCVNESFHTLIEAQTHNQSMTKNSF